MNEFLEKTYKTFKAGKFSRYKSVNIVIGNQSCDLDSSVCALVYAYFCKWSCKSEDYLFLPILNTCREDFTLKKEILYLLDKHNISQDFLLFRNDVNYSKFLQNTNLKFVLVDHHILEGSDDCWKPFVNTILDHRPIDDQNWDYDTKNMKINIKLVGSCATLVCEEICDNDRKFLDQNKDVAHLLYGPIVLDTGNFNPSNDRAKALDFEMASVLDRILCMEECTTFRKELFNSLLKAKTDVSSYTSSELLRIDLKYVNNIPVPGFPMLVKDYLNLPESDVALKMFCEGNCSETLVLIGMKINNDIVHRDLAVYSIKPNNFHEKLVDSLTQTESLLDLEKIESKVEGCDLYKQNNVKYSRKQVIPIIRSTLDKL